ncbi:MAG TPA: AraC family transcriptional regulator [Clostridia bacterium]|nr:AraC family transcriptional regulator [Clostridia bacterium]
MSTPVSSLHALFKHIEQNVQEPLTLDVLSAASGFSAFQLIRLFDRFTGMTPMAYVRARRLAGSIPQLLRGDSVLRIALDWGFEYEQSYIRAFRAAFGTTPARFRRQKEPARITGIPRLGGFTVSASGMVGRPTLLARPAFEWAGIERSYNYQDNLLWGRPLLDGVREFPGQLYAAACKRSDRASFEHRYLVRREDAPQAIWSYPAGQWARFDYGGLHVLDERGAQRIRLLAALVIDGWYQENGLYWDGGFLETADLDKCGADYCELSFCCFVSELIAP